MKAELRLMMTALWMRSLKLDWGGCGDAITRAKTTDYTPSTCGVMADPPLAR